MATTLNSRLHTPRVRAGAHATWLLTIAAAVLALVIGFSAVDIQQKRAGIDQAQTGTPAAAALDGRGKWGGYMK